MAASLDFWLATVLFQGERRLPGDFQYKRLALPSLFFFRDYHHNSLAGSKPDLRAFPQRFPFQQQALPRVQGFQEKAHGFPLPGKVFQREPFSLVVVANPVSFQPDLPVL